MDASGMVQLSGICYNEPVAKICVRFRLVLFDVRVTVIYIIRTSLRACRQKHSRESYPLAAEIILGASWEAIPTNAFL